MSLYERFRLEPIQKTSMEDLPMKTRQSDLDRPVPPKRLSQKSRDLMSNPLPPVRRKRTSTARTAKRTSDSTAKAKSTLQGGKEQPRDDRGRWVKVGAAVLGGAKATVKGVGKAVKGTAKAVSRAHKTVKRVHSSAKKRARLEDRERRIVLAEREKKLGLRKRKIRRVKKGKR
jgi:predicted small secreted protein